MYIILYADTCELDSARSVNRKLLHRCTTGSSIRK